MDSRVACPGCGQPVATSASSADQQVRCPQCRRVFVVPATSAAATNPFLRPKPREEKKPAPLVDTKLLLAGALVMTTIFLPIGLFVAFRLSSSSSPPADAQETASTSAESDEGTTLGASTPVAVVTAVTAQSAANSPAAPPAAAPTPFVPTPQPPVSPTGAVAGTPMPPAFPTSPRVPPAVAGTVTPNSATPNSAVPALPPSSALPTSATELVTQIEPSVVVVDTGRALGSGFVYDEAGTIVTNYHVIEGAKQIVVRFADKSTANVTGYLAIATGKDLAILRIAPQARILKPLRVTSEQPKKAEEVFAFGAPRGLASTVTNGIVSSVRQGTELRDNFKAMTGIDVYTDHQHYDLDAVWIQTTAPISGGNSGGPLVNRQGEVVGLNTWNRTDGQNLNFAISIEHVKKMMESTQSGVQPLASLPKPRKQSASAGDSDKTLAYWNEIGKINRSLFDRLRHTSRPHVPSARKRTPGFFAKLAVYYKRVADFLPDTAHKLRELDMAGVDGDLVALATADALQLEQTAAELRQLSIEAEIGRFVHIVDMDQIHKKTYGRFDFVNIGAAYEKMRLALSSRYQVQFPNISGDAAAPKKVKSSDDDSGEEAEKQASGKLKLAKQLIEAGKRDAARERLEKILEDYPGTAAAEEAEAALAELDAE
jgi:S1-C subfamily serine protease